MKKEESEKEMAEVNNNVLTIESHESINAHVNSTKYPFTLKIHIDDIQLMKDNENCWYYSVNYEISGDITSEVEKTDGYAKIYEMFKFGHYTLNHSTHGVDVANEISRKLPFWDLFASKYTIENRIFKVWHERGYIFSTKLNFANYIDGDRKIMVYTFDINVDEDNIRTGYVFVLVDEVHSDYHENIKFCTLSINDIIKYLFEGKIHESEYTLIP